MASKQTWSLGRLEAVLVVEEEEAVENFLLSEVVERFMVFV
jgi:hypothetical protein